MQARTRSVMYPKICPGDRPITTSLGQIESALSLEPLQNIAIRQFGFYHLDPPKADKSSRGGHASCKSDRKGKNSVTKHGFF